MMYEKCRKCRYRCTCCSSRKDWNNCSGCDRYDEFKPADNIIFCPLDGSEIEKIKINKTTI